MSVAAANSALQLSRAMLDERRQPADDLSDACYLKRRGETEFTAFKLDVVRIDNGAVAEITTFNQDVFTSFGLPAALDR
jgi:hypothetical protein